MKNKTDRLKVIKEVVSENLICNQDDLLKIIEMFDNAMYGHSIYEIREKR